MGRWTVDVMDCFNTDKAVLGKSSIKDDHGTYFSICQEKVHSFIQEQRNKKHCSQCGVTVEDPIKRLNGWAISTN